METSATEPWLSKADWASGKIRCSTRGKMIAACIFAGLWSAISFPAAFFAVRDGVIREGKPEALIALIFPLVGAGLLIWAARSVVAWRKFGTSVFEMAAVPGVIGGRLAGVVLTSLKLHAVGGFHTRLSCVNVVTTGSGKNRSTRESIVWEKCDTMARELLDGGNFRSAIPVSFTIPYSCRPTDESDRNNRIIWRLEVTADVPGTDYEAQFEVPVFRTAASSEDPRVEADPVDAYRAPREDFDPNTAGVTVAPFGPGGVEIRFAPARNPGAAWAITGILLVWAGIVVVLAMSKAPIFFSIIFGLFGLILFYAVLHLWFGRTVVQIGGGRVRVRRGLGEGGKFREVACVDVKDVSITSGMQVGSKCYYDLQLVLGGGKKIAASDGIAEFRHAEKLAEVMREALRRSV